MDERRIEELLRGYAERYHRAGPLSPEAESELDVMMRAGRAIRFPYARVLLGLAAVIVVAIALPMWWGDAGDAGDHPALAYRQGVVQVVVRPHVRAVFRSDPQQLSGPLNPSTLRQDGQETFDITVRVTEPCCVHMMVLDRRGRFDILDLSPAKECSWEVATEKDFGPYPETHEGRQFTHVVIIAARDRLTREQLESAAAQPLGDLTEPLEDRLKERCEQWAKQFGADVKFAPIPVGAEDDPP